MGGSHRVRVLLVDDERDITTMLKTGLESASGFSVDAFNDPRDVMPHFKPSQYDAIVLDINMPEMTGFELARAIWKEDPSAKVCFLSAFEIRKNEAEKVFSEFKQHCFMKKPVEVDSLVKHLERHMLNGYG